jgi:RNA polymerase sigma factor (sigma-70 family)
MAAAAAADWTSGTLAAVSRPSAHAELAELYSRHRAWLLAYSARRLRNRSDAEDAVQQTFVYAFRSLERGVVPQHERAWLATIADNVCRNMSRRGAAAHESPGDVEDAAVADERSSTDARDLAATLAKLPPTQRHALVLREWRGLAYREIAAELDLTEPAVETLLFRARRRAAELLAQRRRVLDVGSALSALRALLGPTAAKVGAAAAVGCVGAAVAVPLTVSRERPATPRPQRTAPETARPGAPADSTVPAAATDQEHAAAWRSSERRERPRTALHPRPTPVDGSAASPAPVSLPAPAAPPGDGAAERVPPRQPPVAPAPSPSPAAQAGTASKRPTTPAVTTTTTTTATTAVDTVADTPSNAADTVTAAAENAVGTVTTVASGAVETVTETAGGAAAGATGAAGGATGATSGAVAGATGAVGGATGAVGTPSLPIP